ncbi:glutaredoxin family protein [Salinicoccus sp. YB14-2]|uniref:glutaredoxin family protein n=1 Tax=Salinicoccus sp. YB14-2 TaxID=1572701 RepID=UPI00068AD8E2|nr:glutaredoxin family protein [Salinicoccus sp. YB14-2]
MLVLDYYTRDRCALCDEGILQIKIALSELREMNVKINKVNIDEDDALQEEYMVRVPVLKHDATIIQEGVLDFVQIYDYLKANKGKQNID